MSGLSRYKTEEFMHASYLLYAYTFPKRKNLVWTATPLNTIVLPRETPRIPTLTTLRLLITDDGNTLISAIELRNLK